MSPVPTPYQGAPDSALSATASELVTDSAVLSVDGSAVDSSVPADQGSPDIVEKGALTNPKRLYISNVSYQTTEDELKDLLSDYEIVSVLIPTQIVKGFKSIHQKSLGIAYVEFANEADTELAKKEINGKIVNDRALRVKSFVPYSPKHTFLKRSRSRRGAFHRRSKSEKPTTTEKIEELDEQTADNVNDEEANGESTVPDAVKESNEEDSNSNLGSGVSVNTDGENLKASGDEGDDKDKKAKKEPETSKDTVFIGRLSPKTTDGDLREFFHEFGPTDVFIFKNRLNKRQYPLRFHQRHVSALVTLSAEDGVSKAIDSLNEQKIRNKAVGIRAAYISKIEDVKKAAEVRQKKQAKMEQEANAAASAAASGVSNPDDSNKGVVAKEQLPTEEAHEDSIDVVQEDDDDESVGFKIENKQQSESAAA